VIDFFETFPAIKVHVCHRMLAQPVYRPFEALLLRRCAFTLLRRSFAANVLTLAM
jgi:hypothetical protein